MRATCVWYSRSNARPSPEAASATSAVSASRPVWLRSLRSVATPGVVSSMCLIRYGLGVKGCSGSGRLRAVTTSLSALAGLGLLLGFRHAFEPDHLAAVSTLATRQGRLLDACRLGLAWALGHSVSVGVVVGAIILFGLHLPDRLWPAAAILVLLVAAAPTRAAQVAYFLAFAAGTTIGMLAVSVSLASVVRLASTRGARWATLLHLGSAAASVVVGLLLAGRVAGDF